MPRYCYRCESCEKEFITFHGIKDVFSTCKLCNTEDRLIKLLSVPTVIKEEKRQDKKVGDLTEEYIELNKEILQQEKEKVKETIHESS